MTTLIVCQKNIVKYKCSQYTKMYIAIVQDFYLSIITVVLLFTSSHWQVPLSSHKKANEKIFYEIDLLACWLFHWGSGRCPLCVLLVRMAKLVAGVCMCGLLVDVCRLSPNHTLGHVTMQPVSSGTHTLWCWHQEKHAGYLTKHL